MNANLRACIANIAARINGQHVRGAVYDYDQRKHIHVSGNVGDNRVAIYDHDRGAHVTGSHTSLYDYNVGAHIALRMNGDRFSGYDYGSSSHFNGTLNGPRVTICNPLTPRTTWK